MWRRAHILGAGLLFASSAPVWAGDTTGRWQGCYGGVNLGAARAEMSATDVPVTSGGAPGGISWNDPPGEVINAGVDTAIGGGQLGCDFRQESGGTSWVIGIVGDFGLMSASGGAGSALSSDTHISFSADYAATLRARVGIVTGTSLIYLTGGLAATEGSLRAFDLGDASPGMMDVSQSQTLTGWTLGAGVEWPISDRATVALEYQHMDFGTISASGPALNVASTPRFDGDLTADTLRLVLNWHL